MSGLCLGGIQIEGREKGEERRRGVLEKKKELQWARYWRASDQWLQNWGNDADKGDVLREHVLPRPDFSFISLGRDEQNSKPQQQKEESSCGDKA